MAMDKQTWWNVALDGRHLFRTDKYSESDERIYFVENHLAQAFPSSKGYSISRSEQSAMFKDSHVPN